MACASCDCLSLLGACGTARGGISARKSVRKSCWGSVSALVRVEARLGAAVDTPAWGGAEHNMNPLGNERLQPEARLNWACDLLAKHAAHSDATNELSYHGYWEPLPAD